MKLYYAPGVCSLASHITAREAGVELDLEKVDLHSKKTESGVDFHTVNPKNYVPVLILDDGGQMTESAAILQYLADRNPAANLVPAAGTMDRYRVIEWLSYTSGEIHKALWLLFDPLSTDALKQTVRERLKQKIARFEEALKGQDFLAGDRFGIADAYAFVILGGVQHFGVDLASFPAVGAWMARISSRPAVVQAMKNEGLIPAA